MLNQFSFQSGSTDDRSIAYIPSGEMQSTTVQSAIDELTKAANYNPWSQVSYFEDFAWANLGLNLATGELALSGTQNNGGAIVATAGTTNPQFGRWGIIALSAGPTGNSTGQAYLYSDLSDIYCGMGATVVLQFAAMVPVLGTSTVGFQYEIGLRNDFTGAQTNSGSAFLYNFQTSTNWQAYSSNNGTATAVTSSSAVFFGVSQTAWYNFKMVIGLSQIDYYVGATTGSSGMVLLGSATTNLPSLAHPGYLQVMMSKGSSTTTQSRGYLDWMKLDIGFVNQR